jgi:small-conductance mechanosensitive channel
MTHIASLILVSFYIKVYVDGFFVAYAPRRLAAPIPNTATLLGEKVSSLIDINEVAQLTPFESFFPLLNALISKTVGSADQAKKVVTFLRLELSDLFQIGVCTLLGYALPLLGKSISFKVLRRNTSQPYNTTKLYHILNHISQGFKLAAFATLVESTAQFVGVDEMSTAVLTNTLSSVCFSVWGMFRVKPMKRYVVNRMCSHANITNKRLIKIYQRLASIMVYIITAVIVLDTLGFHYQRAIEWLLRSVGIGTLALTFASRDLTSQLISGATIGITQPFDIGDSIELSNGECGVIESVNMFHTYIRRPNEIIVKIPNADMEQNQVSNLSDTKYSQVKQTLHLTLAAIKKIDTLIDNIKKEIIQSCPKLVIRDEHRSFRVHWTSYKHRHIEVTVDCKFDIPPGTDEFYDNQQEVLKAIARATHDVEVNFSKD